MPGWDIVRLACSKRPCYRVYAILALQIRVLIRLVAWVLEVMLDLDGYSTTYK